MNKQQPLIQQGTIDFVKKIRGKRIRWSGWPQNEWAVYQSRFKQDQVLLKNSNGVEMFVSIQNGFNPDQTGAYWEFYNPKKVIAIADSFDDITKDFIYDVISEDDDKYTVITDSGVARNYLKTYFKVVPDAEYFEIATIDECDCDRWGYEEIQLFTSRFMACRKCGKEKK